jgi:hypothetical protein
MTAGMHRLPPLLIASTALGLLPPLTLEARQAAAAAELNIAAVGGVAKPPEQVSSINQFSDVRPTDWAYQALSNLIERHGCIAGHPSGSFQGGQALSRYEAAALLNVCLDRITEVTDELKRLIKEFEQELTVLKGRMDGLEAKVGELEATRFSTTTRLSGLATFVLGASHFGGSASGRVRQAGREFGATTFNYDLQLTLDTSFNGKDLLRTNLRAGNFADSSFGGAGPTILSQLETAFQEDLDVPGSNGSDVVAIERLYYQWPLGEFTLTLGPRVGQEDMLAIWPSVYPSDTVLDVLTYGGAPTALNSNLGAGAGIWWKRGGFAVSANVVAANGDNGDPSSGGIATDGAGSTGTVQIGYTEEQWGVAATYSRIQNGNDLIPYATTFALESFSQPGLTHAFGFSGYWQPASAGWLPSISAGWGINGTQYDGDVDSDGLVATSQSWSVGLEWQDVAARGNALGMAVGQPTFATALNGGATPTDGNFAWEWWFKLQVSDAISVTPALFYLSRPDGQATPSGRGFDQLGGLIKTTFRF